MVRAAYRVEQTTKDSQKDCVPQAVPNPPSWVDEPPPDSSVGASITPVAMRQGHAVLGAYA